MDDVCAVIVAYDLNEHALCSLNRGSNVVSCRCSVSIWMDGKGVLPDAKRLSTRGTRCVFLHLDVHPPVWVTSEALTRSRCAWTSSFKWFTLLVHLCNAHHNKLAAYIMHCNCVGCFSASQVFTHMVLDIEF
jgi:hypothetical protein